MELCLSAPKHSGLINYVHLWRLQPPTVLQETLWSYDQQLRTQKIRKCILRPLPAIGRAN